MERVVSEEGGRFKLKRMLVCKTKSGGNLELTEDGVNMNMGSKEREGVLKGGSMAMRERKWRRVDKRAEGTVGFIYGRVV